jgi:hypothetical protein
MALAGVAQQLRLRPAGHPMLASSLAALDRALASCLAERPELVIEVGSVQLTADQMETDPGFEPLRHLAMQIRDAGVGAMIMRQGLMAAEVVALFRVMQEGNIEARGLPESEHLSLRAHRASGPHARDPWLALERLVLEDPDRSRVTRDVTELALALELYPATPAFDVRVLELLAQASLLSEGVVHIALDALIMALPAKTLRRLLGPRRNPVTQQEFLRAMVPTLTPAAMLRICQALASGRHDLMSASGLRVLARLAMDATRNERAAVVMEQAVLRLAELSLAEGSPPPRLTPEPDRVLKLALESGIAETGTRGAADRMIARKQVGALLALLDTVPRNDPVAMALRERLHHPQSVRAILAAQPVDLDSLDRLIPAAGIETAPVLLDALADSRERRVRMRLLEFLSRFGDPVGSLALERFDGMPWYVQRNLVHLISRLPDTPTDFPFEALLGHRDVRVRHEAIAVALNDPEQREFAVEHAISSDHPATLQMGLECLQDYCPPEYLPRVTAVAMDPLRDEEVRAGAIMAVAASRDPATLRILRRLVVGRGITSLGRLAPRSPTMLAALRGLAAHWPQHPKVGMLLDTARQSRDADVRDAARPVTRRVSASYRSLT